MFKPKNGKSTFILIAVFALAIVAIGWYLITSQPSGLDLKSDKTSYFNVDKPNVELSVQNYKDASDGTVVIGYNADILMLSETNASAGVTYKELGNSVYFELGEEFFGLKTNKIADLTFENKTAGTGEIKFDSEKTKLNNDKGEMKLALHDVSFSVGVAGRIGDTEGSVKEANTSDYKEF